MPQRKKICQALINAQNLFLETFIVDLAKNMTFGDDYKKIEYHQNPKRSYYANFQVHVFILGVF